jgi:2-oxoglutarate dehydrogenase E2 component (dihydrolipoamide succinyltransferase)
MALIVAGQIQSATNRLVKGEVQPVPLTAPAGGYAQQYPAQQYPAQETPAQPAPAQQQAPATQPAQQPYREPPPPPAPPPA